MATINDFGIPGVSNTIFQPKLSDRFRVTFTNFGSGASSVPVSANVISTARPQLEWEEVQLDRYNSRAYVAGKHVFQLLPLVISDSVDGEASRVLRDQLSKQQWLIGAEGAYLAAAPEGSLYNFTTILEMLDGGENVLERWVVEGCWLKSIDFGQLEYATSQEVKISMQIRYAMARQVIGNYTSGEGRAIGGGLAE